MAGAATEELQDLCNEGLSLQLAGRPAEAKLRYEAVLARDPDHFNGLCLLGALYLESRQFDPAVVLIGRALGGVSGATAPLQARAAAYNNLGAALSALDRHQEAEEAFKTASQLQPGFSLAHAGLGALLLKRGRLPDALAAYDRAIAVDPADASAWFGRAYALQKANRVDEALAAYERAAQLRPGDAASHINRGILLVAHNRPDEALAVFQAALAVQPGSAQARNGMGSALFHLGRFQAARDAFLAAAAADPNWSEPRVQLAGTLFVLNQFESALAEYDRAAALGARDAVYWFGRGVVLNALERFDEALGSYDEALRLDRSNQAARFQASTTLLRAGRLRPGWQAYEARRERPEWLQGPWVGLDEGRRWLGGSLAGKTLFVHHEQGFGDTLQFLRFLEPLEARGAALIVSVQAPLRSLAQRLAPHRRMVDEGTCPAGFDLHCPLLSLPLALGLDTIPEQKPYVVADEGRRARFSASIGPRRRPRVGLAWSGRPTHDNDRNRSIPFAVIQPLLSGEVDWICLQKDVRPDERVAVEAQHGLSFHGDALADFEDTAALTDLTDLVITVDTSVAHLAGALGKPTWILLPTDADWRWMTGRSDTPWYPSARLFRQARPGDWPAVIEDVRAALRGSAWVQDGT